MRLFDSPVCVVFVKVLASSSYDDTVRLYSEDGDDWNCFATLGTHGFQIVHSALAIAYFL